jgi:hypothetical protein
VPIIQMKLIVQLGQCNGALGTVGLTIIGILIWRVCSAYKTSQRNFDDVKETCGINNLVGGASLIMFVLIVLGEVIIERPISWVITPATPNPQVLSALLPSVDFFLSEHKNVYLVAALVYGVVYLLPTWIRQKTWIGSLFRRGLNCALFVLGASYVFLWVAHTGGLTGLYGAAYLSLFSVAMVVPKSRIIKWSIGLPVGAGAMCLALLSPNREFEWYLCLLSIAGSFTANLLQAHLNQNDLNSNKEMV